MAVWPCTKVVVDSVRVREDAATFVTEKLAAPEMPDAVAVIEYVPAVLLAANASELAMPALLVKAVQVVELLEKVPVAPLEGAVNVTDALGTGLPLPSFTRADNSAGNVVPTEVLCPEPP